MLQFTARDIINFAKTLQGKQLETLWQHRPFSLDVVDDEIMFENSLGKSRTHGGRYLRDVCDRFSKTGSYRPSHYHDLTVNASYILAVIRQYVQHVSQSQAVPV